MESQDSDYNETVDTLMFMFGDVMSRDVVFAVVESCGGDSNLAAEAIMNITSEVNSNENTTNETSTQSVAVDDTTHRNMIQTQESKISNQQTNPTPNQPTSQPSYSYAHPNRGAVPKKPKPSPINSIHWTDQLRRICTYHNEGSRILILMRGVPGSGKSYLARQIVEMTIGSSYADYLTHICSTDDYFMVRGNYQFERYRLPEAHDWNQNRVRLALIQGLSPVIIDNTNIEMWEMEPYLREGVRNGYIIEVLEPDTHWARKANQLVKRNIHNVPLPTIKRMLENYVSGITGEKLRNDYGLSYPADMVPPVMRNMPAVTHLQEKATKPGIIKETNMTVDSTVISGSNNQSKQINSNIDRLQLPSPLNTPPVLKVNQKILSPRSINSTENETQEDIPRQKRHIEIQKQLEEMEIVEQAWENGEAWDEESREAVKDASKSQTLPDPKPPRINNSEESTPTEKLLETVINCEDWRQISMFMPPWTDLNSKEINNAPQNPIEKISSSTCMEIGDKDLHMNTLKIKTATPRDINMFHISFNREKIPEKRMLDKSTMTNEQFSTDAFRCKNEEKHFVAFRKLFKNIPKASLRDVFDKCCGDVNWAVDIILGGMANNELEIIDSDSLSDEDEDGQELCSCLAAYNVIPDQSIQPPSTTNNQQDIPESTDSFTINLPQKKVKVTPSDSTVQLKRQIEKNFTISDNHYSPHCLKIRKMRRGEYNEENSLLRNIDEYISNSVSNPANQLENAEDLQDNKLNTLKEDGKCASADSSDDEESNTSINNDDLENTVNINLGKEFLAELDNLFGRKQMTYPDDIVPRVNIPMSLLNEINAFWMESLMYQLDEYDKKTAKMIKEDEEFARQLAMKEAELEKEGKEPEVPDFKEIMDIDFALSLYQKDVAEWRNKEPNDIAAKMSRDKLYNLFPDMQPDILAELLMAHENNFQATVEVLLMSTGKDDILKEKNGLNKFVMKKEMERQEKILAEEKKALCEVQWPLLPAGEKVEMSVVNKYREKADRHLAHRNLSYQKANDYVRRGMTQVANYYSDLASFHKQKYEQANSLAAASLMQVHASNFPDNTTIDLHYLRVGEAKESLDLFLDTHIQKLKESPNGAHKYRTLFFITGRGLHSHGRPRVKPAVKKRLQERGLGFGERNPGLLTAKVCAEDKLSYQIP